MKIFLIAGARPNFMKIAPLIHELERVSPSGGVPGHGPAWKLIHTGQHYDFKMSKVFFRDFDIPEPDYFLDAGSGSHAEQTAKIMVEFEKVCAAEKADIVVVVGDVNSTLACSIVAKKLNIRVAHIEAGLRSGDMTMPEEINRIVTDSISDYLFVTERSGLDNLHREGKNGGKVFFTGNVMIDTLFYSLEKIKNGRAGRIKRESAGIPGKSGYAVLTLHRPSNVDSRERLGDILDAINRIAADMDIYFPLHPRTEKNIRNFGLGYMTERFSIIPPLSYLDFLSLWKDSDLVLTDSGGIQEETTALGIPCFTIRENTERPVTIEEGTNTLVGTAKDGILKAYSEFREGVRKKGRVPELWDGKAAGRIVQILLHGME